MLLLKAKKEMVVLFMFLLVENCLLELVEFFIRSGEEVMIQIRAHFSRVMEKAQHMISSVTPGKCMVDW